MESYWDIILRTCAVYLFIVAAIRIFGKTQLAQLSVFDLVFILLISNSVQNAMVGPDASLSGGLIAAGSLFLLNYLFKSIVFRNKKISRLLQGDPVLLIHHGRLIQSNIDEIRLPMEELEAAIREHGVGSVEEVDLAMLETDGNISILSQNYKHESRIKRKPKRFDTKKT